MKTMQEMKNHKFYVVMADTYDVETDLNTQKIYRYRKSAEKYGCELVEKYGHCTIATFIGTDCVETEQY